MIVIILCQVRKRNIIAMILGQSVQKLSQTSNTIFVKMFRNLKWIETKVLVTSQNILFLLSYSFAVSFPGFSLLLHIIFLFVVMCNQLNNHTYN